MNSPLGPKDERFTVAMSKSDKAKLLALAEARRSLAAEVLVDLVREAFTMLHRDEQAPEPAAPEHLVASTPWLPSGQWAPADAAVRVQRLEDNLRGWRLSHAKPEPEAEGAASADAEPSAASESPPSYSPPA